MGTCHSLDALVLDVLLVPKEYILDLLFGDFTEVARVARSSGFELEMSERYSEVAYTEVRAREGELDGLGQYCDP